MKIIEMLWRKTAARNRFQMRQCAVWWRETGERAFLDAAIKSRDDWRDAVQQAETYARKERAS